jgi:hypothetical protein
VLIPPSEKLPPFCMADLAVDIDAKAQEQAVLSATQAVARPQHSITISNPPWSALDDLLGDEEEEVFEEALIPPENFNMVSEYIYRSSFPKKKHFTFLKKLGLKSVLLVTNAI